LEDDRLCTLVMIGVRPDGTKELITVEDGHRESAENWKADKAFNRHFPDVWGPSPSLGLDTGYRPCDVAGKGVLAS